MVEKTCLTCTKTFMVFKYRKKANFCSHPCYWADLKLRPSKPTGRTFNHTAEAKEKIRLAGLGRVFSEETKKKISEKAKLRGFPEATRLKSLSPESLAKRTGENHPLWIKDRNKLKRFNDVQKDRRSSAYNTWRREVYKRDGYTCRIHNEDCSGRLEAHHILGFTEHEDLRYNINNGITLCHFHHPRVREEEKRLSPYFMELVSVSKDKF